MLNDEEKKAIEYLSMYAEDMENRAYEEDLTWHIYRVLNLIQNQETELKKKDRIIDLIANEIFYKLNSDSFEYGYSIEEVKQYFEKKVEGM